jgi:hypothetical protein
MLLKTNDHQTDEHHGHQITLEMNELGPNILSIPARMGMVMSSK